MKNNTKAYLLAILAVGCWSTSASGFKIALAQMPLAEVLWIASLTAALIFGVTLLLSGRMSVLKTMGWAGLRRTMLLGMLNPCIYYVLLLGAYDRLPAQIAQPVNYIWPVALTLLSARLLHTKVPGVKYIGMFISFAGVGVISLSGYYMGGFSVFGFLMALASAGLWAYYWILNISSRNDAVGNLFVSFAATSVVTGAVALVLHDGSFSMEAVGAAMFVGAFEMGVPFLLWGAALRLTKNHYIVNQIGYFTPFLSLFFISMWLDERISTATVVGLVLIVAGCVFNYFCGNQPQQASAPVMSDDMQPPTTEIV